MWVDIYWDKRWAKTDQDSKDSFKEGDFKKDFRGDFEKHLEEYLELEAMPCFILPDVQVPHTVSIVTDPNPGVSGDHVVLNSEDCTPVIVDPGNLQHNIF